MRAIVTGGNGRVGQSILRDLVQAGHAVTNLDIAMPSHPVPGVATMRGDLTNSGDIYGAIAYVRAEAVVHMAAWADPGLAPDTRVYADNTASVFNVLDACAALSVRRVIIASSAQVYGFAGHAPLYAPVDEAHPLRPLNSYALSKVAAESAAGYFAGRGLNVLVFRIMGARPPEALVEEIAAVRADPAGDASVLWTRTDARDIALACRKALEVEQVESGVYNLTGATNVVGKPSRDLFAAHFPSTELRPGLVGNASALSIEKARQAFGYEPRYSMW